MNLIKCYVEFGFHLSIWQTFMNKKNYKYDVAFSFLKEDEGLAQELNSLLKEKTETFIYTNRQDKIAGTDGEETFNRVFGQEARVAIVLYRKGWGTTPWTRIEETAIKNRALDEGYGFTLFIPLDQPPEVPDYLPKTYIWYGIHKYGIKVVQSIIESKIQSEGGEIKIESPEDVAKRIKETELFKNKRNAYLQSLSGIEAANAEVRKLYSLLKDKKEIIEKEQQTFSIGFEEKDQNCYIHIYGYTIRFYWYKPYNNSLFDSYLNFDFQSPNRYPEKPTIIISYRYNFDITESDTNIWVLVSDRQKNYTSEELVNYSFNIILKYIEKKIHEDRSNKYL